MTGIMQMFVGGGQGALGPWEYKYLAGSLYETGANLANLTTNVFSSPIQVGSDTTWTVASTNAFSSGAIKNGALYVWGNNAAIYNNLSSGSYSSPVQIGAQTDWEFISLGYPEYITAIKTNGSLWTWGTNSSGVLGNNSVTATSSPVQLGSLTNWEKYKISANQSQVFAIKTDGTLWAWGSNFYGQLGLGDTVDKSSPVQIGSQTDWAFVHSGYQFTMAVKNDGTLWAWGYNLAGQLGDGTTITRSSPVQIGSLTTWRYAFAAYASGGTGSSVAQKSDGTLWTWGSNYEGGLAENSNYLTYRSSPVQVGTDTDWNLKYTKDAYWAFAGLRTTTNNLWVWGNNSYGKLGLNDLVNRSSPVQVGSISNVKSVAMGYDKGLWIV